MVNAAYDHIVAIAVVGMIFIGAVVAMPAINYANFQTVDQQQLRNTALNVFNSMLWAPGSPPNWGSQASFDQNKVATFGLAFSGSFSKFVLDANKVQRLDTEAPGYIEYSRVKELLELNDYGFQLTLFRPFRVEWDLDLTNRTVWFSVNVTRTEDGTPIPNAKIKVTTMVTASKWNKNFDDDPIKVPFDPITKYTDVYGNCKGSQTLPSTTSGYSIDYAVAIMHIDVGGMTTTVVAESDNPISKYIKIRTFDDTIVLTFADELGQLDTQSERRVIDIEAFDTDNLIQIFDGINNPPPAIKITKGDGYVSWSITFKGLRALDPTALLFVMQLTLKTKGRVYALIAGPFSFGESEKIFEFGPEPIGENVIAIMRRFVLISDTTYVAQIAMWKE